VKFQIAIYNLYSVTLVSNRSGMCWTVKVTKGGWRERPDRVQILK